MTERLSVPLRGEGSDGGERVPGSGRIENDDGIVIERFPDGGTSFGIFDAGEWAGHYEDGQAYARLIADAFASNTRLAEAVKELVEGLGAALDDLETLAFGSFAPATAGGIPTDPAWHEHWEREDPEGFALAERIRALIEKHGDTTRNLAGGRAHEAGS